MKLLFVGSFGIITRSRTRGRNLFVDALGLPLHQPAKGDFVASTKLEGSRYFGVWPLSEVARICLGTRQWPADRPVPQAFIEFETDSAASVASVASELEAKGYALLHPPRTDPWGQTASRLQTEDGFIVGISYVPWMHRRTRARSKARARRRR